MLVTTGTSTREDYNHGVHEEGKGTEERASSSGITAKLAEHHLKLIRSKDEGAPTDAMISSFSGKERCLVYFDADEGIDVLSPFTKEEVFRDYRAPFLVRVEEMDFEMKAMQKERRYLEKELKSYQVEARTAVVFGKLSLLRFSIAGIQREKLDMTCTTKDGMDLFRVALQVNNLDAVKEMREAGYPFDRALYGWQTPHALAIRAGHVFVADFLASTETRDEAVKNACIHTDTELANRTGLVKSGQGDIIQTNMCLRDIVNSFSDFVEAKVFSLNTRCEEKMPVFVEFMEDACIYANHTFEITMLEDLKYQLIMRIQKDDIPFVIYGGVAFALRVEKSATEELVHVSYQAYIAEDGNLKSCLLPDYVPEEPFEMPYIQSSKFQLLATMLPIAAYITFYNRIEGTNNEKMIFARDLVLKWLEWDCESWQQRNSKAYPMLAEHETILAYKDSIVEVVRRSPKLSPVETEEAGIGNSPVEVVKIGSSRISAFSRIKATKLSESG